MSIRKRLLILLLPPLIFFLIAISILFYLKWSQEITRSFETQLRLVSMTAAETFTPRQVKWLQGHIKDPTVGNLPLFRDLSRTLTNIRKRIYASELSLVLVEEVPVGERLFPDKPQSMRNPEREEAGSILREVTLLETRAPWEEEDQTEVLVGKIRRVKPLEKEAFEKKQTLISPPYFSSHRKTTIMTAYAPILSDSGDVVALIVSSATLEKIDYEKARALLLIVLASAIAIVLMVLCVSWVAESLSQPVRKLNAAALAIAAGEYGEQIQTEGPKEVQELANTFNTMSQCLDETMGQLQERSTARERMQGEYECSLLLQHFMLGQPIQKFSSKRVSLEMVKASTGTPSRGLLLQEKVGATEDWVQVVESQKAGFEGTYALLSRESDLANFPSVSLWIRNQLLVVEDSGFPLPILWDRDEGQLAVLSSGEYPLHLGDLLFLYNSPLLEQFSGPKSVERWIAKILRHFGKEDPVLLASMLRNEMQFLIKKRPLMEEPILLWFMLK